MIFTFIYVLRCPLTKEIRYVGKTNNPKERYHNHLNRALDKGTHKRNWINSLRKKGIRPIFEIIKKVSIGEWKGWEKYYIKYYKSKGCKLINIMDGGEGLTFGNHTSFKKGMIPWNKGSRMKKYCVICGKKFEVSPSGDKRYKCCSMKCSNVYKSIYPNVGCFKKGAISWNKGSKYRCLQHKNCKPVLQIDKITGEIVKDYPSITEASRLTNISAGGISSNINNRSKSSGGYLWESKGKDF